jgi:hypothetical protein
MAAPPLCGYHRPEPLQQRRQDGGEVLVEQQVRIGVEDEQLLVRGDDPAEDLADVGEREQRVAAAGQHGDRAGDAPFTHPGQVGGEQAGHEPQRVAAAAERVGVEVLGS